MHKNRKLAWLLVVAMVFTIMTPLTAGTAVAEAATMGDLVTELNQVYPFIDDNEKGFIRDARSGLSSDSTDWDAVLNPLINSTVEARLGNDPGAKTVFKDIAADIGKIYYSTDAAVLESRLSGFKSNHSANLKKLFDDEVTNEITMDKMADFLIATRGKLKSAAIDTGNMNTILFGSNDNLVAAMPVIVKKAAETAVAEPGFDKFKNKLSDIDWNTDLLLDRHYALAEEVDSGNKAELALAKAYVRSQAKVARDGAPIVRSGILWQDSIAVGATPSYTLSILEHPATNLVKYAVTSADGAIEVVKEGEGNIQLKGIKPGTAELVFYRDNVECDAAKDWIARVNITVVQPSSGGGGGGPSFGGTEVKSGQGGSVSGSGATVNIPANAFPSDVRVKIEEVISTTGLSIPAAAQLVSDVLEITKNKTENFTQPITITLTFDKSKVDTDKYEIGLYWYDTVNGKWVKLDNIIVDLAAGKVSGETTHFTKFAVLAVPKEAPPLPPVVNLTDIAGHWAEDSIKALVDRGAIGGYPDNTFKPNRIITRAEFATVLVRAFKLEARDGKVFADTANHWAKDVIATANAHGIVNGYSATQFGPDDPITREQMAIMVVNAAKLPASDQAPTFKDSAKISSWAKSAVNSAAAAGAISGYPDGTYKPQQNATRAEAMSIIVRVLK